MSIQKHRGFTLIELVIIMGVLSLSLLALSKIFPFGFEAKNRAENYSRIGILAQNLVEQIKRDGYGVLDKKYPEKSPEYGKKTGKFKKYPGFCWQVEWWQTKIPNLRKIKVKVYRKIKGAEPLQMEIVTYLANRG